MPNNGTTFCRLPTSVKPSHYKLELEPDLENFTFNGSVDINIDVSFPFFVKHSYSIETLLFFYL